jgi:hypothetical protein
MAVVDEGVLVDLVGGKPADRRQGTDGLRRDRGDAHQGQQEDDDQAEDYDAPKVAPTTLAPASEMTLAAPAGG